MTHGTMNVKFTDSSHLYLKCSRPKFTHGCSQSPIHILSAEHIFCGVVSMQLLFAALVMGTEASTTNTLLPLTFSSRHF